MSSSLDPIALDMKEAAKYIGISMRTLQRRMSKKHEIGKIRYINIGRRVLFPKFELDRWLKEEASDQPVEIIRCLLTRFYYIIALI